MKHVMFAIGSLYGGGAERVVSVWANALAQKGYSVSLMMYARVKNEYQLSDNVKVHTIAQSTEVCNNMSMLDRVRAFRKILKNAKPNVIISFLPEMQVYVNIASKGLRIPRIETIRINPWKAGITQTKYGLLWKMCFENSRAVILQTKDQGEFFSKRVRSKSIVIPNPINEIYIKNQKAEYNTTHNIVAAGRLSDQKNYNMLIDVIAIVVKKYPDVCLRIFGEGEQAVELAKYIEQQDLSKNVSLMGRCNNLVEKYIESDCYVMSSDYEGMPNALAEAMAVGLPCISTDCRTGPKDLIDDGENGYLVPVGDAFAMAQAIMRVFSMSPESQGVIGRKAREKILAFCSEENSLDKLCRLIDGV